MVSAARNSATLVLVLAARSSSARFLVLAEGNGSFFYAYREQRLFRFLVFFICEHRLDVVVAALSHLYLSFMVHPTLAGSPSLACCASLVYVTALPSYDLASCLLGFLLLFLHSIISLARESSPALTSFPRLFVRFQFLCPRAFGGIGTNLSSSDGPSALRFAPRLLAPLAFAGSARKHSLSHHQTTH